MKNWISAGLFIFIGTSIIGCASTSSSEHTNLQASAQKEAQQPLKNSQPEKLRVASLPSTQWFINDEKQKDIG